jgi:hypothetical protein
VTALYATIWLALGLFVAGESGRSFVRPGARPPAWSWWAFAAGAALAVAHTLLSFQLVHHWSHTAAVQATAQQTRAVYGIEAGWGVYVNYLFIAVWAADAYWWRAAPASSRPAALTWTLRAFYMLIVFNAAIVFVAGLRKIIGLLMVSWLARVWSGAGVPPQSAPTGPSRAPSSPLR